MSHRSLLGFLFSHGSLVTCIFLLSLHSHQSFFTLQWYLSEAWVASNIHIFPSVQQNLIRPRAFASTQELGVFEEKSEP